MGGGGDSIDPRWMLVDELPKVAVSWAVVAACCNCCCWCCWVARSCWSAVAVACACKVEEAPVPFPLERDTAEEDDPPGVPTVDDVDDDDDDATSPPSTDAGVVCDTPEQKRRNFS